MCEGLPDFAFALTVVSCRQKHLKSNGSKPPPRRLPTPVDWDGEMHRRACPSKPIPQTITDA